MTYAKLHKIAEHSVDKSPLAACLSVKNLLDKDKINPEKHLLNTRNAI
jgi:hypothetical protein